MNINLKIEIIKIFKLELLIITGSKSATPKKVVKDKEGIDYDAANSK